MCKKGCKVKSHNHYEFTGLMDNIMNPKKKNPPSKNDGAFMKMAKKKSDDILTW
jgi:hypothetical protein